MVKKTAVQAVKRIVKGRLSFCVSFVSLDVNLFFSVLRSSHCCVSWTVFCTPLYILLQILQL